MKEGLVEWKDRKDDYERDLQLIEFIWWMPYRLEGNTIIKDHIFYYFVNW